MSQSASKNQNATWTDEEIEALLQHFLEKRSGPKGAGGFNNTVFQSAAVAIRPLFKKGAIKEAKHVKGKWRAVCITFTIRCATTD